MEEKKVVTIEGKLAGMLRPVAPRREFVHGLGNRIQTLRHTMTQTHSNTWMFLLIMLAGMLSLGLLLALAGRGLVVLLGARK